MRISDWSSDVCSSDLDRRHVVVDAEAPPPGEIALAGIEYLSIDAAGPDADVVVHPLLAEQLGHRIGGREDGVAAAIETPEGGLDERFQEGEAVIADRKSTRLNSSH